MRRPRPVLLVGLMVAAVVAAGCGGGSSSTPDNPKAELSASLDNLTGADALTTTIGLGVSPAALQRFAQAEGSHLSAADAQTIATAHLVVETKTSDGKDLSGSKGSNFSLVGSSGGRTLVELRVVGGDLYLQGDIRGVLALAHKSNVYGEVKARAATLPGFVRAFVAGRWVSLAGAAAQGLLGTFGGTPSGTGSGVANQVTSDLKKVLDRDVAVRKVGTDSRGDHLVLSGHSRKLAADLLQAIGNDVPGGSLALSKADPSTMHDRAVSVDAWVKDGVLRQVSIDVGQFTDTTSAHLPVTISFDQSGGDITRPSGATPVDLTQLSSLMGALNS